MTWVAVGTAVVGAAGAYENNQAAKNGQAKPLNVSKAISDAQTQQANDLQNSINLENQYLPGQAALRSQSNALNSNITLGNTQSQQLLSQLLQQAGGSITNPNAYLNNPLTTAANSSILQSLNQGGALDPSTQAQVTQGALQGAGTAGISGSGAGRGLVARDLGLTSLQLLQTRQQAASQAGNAYGALGLQSQALQLQDYLGRVGLAQNAVGQQDQYGLGLGTLMNNTALPNSGLSGSQVASLDVGNTNIINGANQQQSANQVATNNAYAGILQGLISGGGSSSSASGIAGLFSGSGGTSGGFVSGTSGSTLDTGG